MQFEKQEIHTVFLCFPNLLSNQKLSLSALADLFRASLTLRRRFPLAKKILFVATVVKTHILEFHVPYLKMMQELGWETAVAGKNDFEPDEVYKLI